MTNILLIIAVKKPNKFSSYPKIPLGVSYIASYLRKYNDSVQVDIIERSYEHDVSDLVRKYNPNILGISSSTQNYNSACSIANQVKAIDKEILTVIGGHHITALPQNLDRAIDIGVLGEGEETFSEIVRAYEKNGPGKLPLNDIPGIVFWNEGKIALTNKRNLIKPLDKIPFPARDIFTIGEEANILTSRGCPYKCTYCAAGSFWSTVRFHTPEYVVGEIKDVISKYKVKAISIDDDLFIADPKRVKEISRLIQEEGINKKVRFFCHCRANLLNEEIAGHLKSMNVEKIGIGFETGSETVLNRIKKGSVSMQQNKNALKVAKKYGFTVHGYFMIGSPNETREEMMETYEFIKDSPIDSFDLSVMIPFPATEIWDYAISRNLVAGDMNWDLLDMDFVVNNKEYLILDDKVSKKDLNKLYFKIKNEINNKRKRKTCEKVFGKKLGPLIYPLTNIPGVYELGGSLLTKHS